jgi:hypothetical protein
VSCVGKFMRRKVEERLIKNKYKRNEPLEEEEELNQRKGKEFIFCKFHEANRSEY